MKRLLLSLLLLCAVPASAAILYSRFSHPTGDYVIEYPAHWKRSLGLQAVYLHPAGKLAPQALISLERYPLGKDSPRTPEDFEKDLRKDLGFVKKLESEGSKEISGVRARRLVMTMTDDSRPVRDPSGGRYKEIVVILPLRGGFYYVLKLAGVGRGFEKALPEFEKIIGRLRLPVPDIEKK